ncbi:MAG: WD40/YVTN/BNR-like repeat-containing protein [Nocardioidaceae bacterium]
MGHQDARKDDTGPSAQGHPALFRISDCGAHFRQVTAPVVRARTGRPLPILKLVFVGPDHGYAIVGPPRVSRPTVLLYTADAARSWRRARLPGAAAAHIDAVAGHGGQVFAAAIRCGRPVRCRKVAVYYSPTGSGNWHRTGAALPARDSDSRVGLAAWGATVWLMLGVGDSRHPVTLRSVNSARTFTTLPPTYAVVCSPAATSVRVVWTSCRTGMMFAFQRTSGRGPVRSLPVAGAGTGDTFLDPLSDSVAYFGTAVGRQAGVYRTRDGGRTFTRVAGFPRPAARSGVASQVTFLDTRVGLAILTGPNVLRTIDRGHTWRRIPLPAS